MTRAEVRKFGRVWSMQVLPVKMSILNFILNTVENSERI